MQHRLSTVLGRQLNRRPDGEKESITVAEWAPVVDIIEDEAEYLIKVDLPEIKKEEVKVTVENGVLVLSGERKLEKEEKGRKYHRIERSLEIRVGTPVLELHPMVSARANHALIILNLGHSRISKTGR
jgi:HSP20 family molecular chaperone IbpA